MTQLVAEGYGPDLEAKQTMPLGGFIDNLADAALTAAA